jgi:hypothetical protein
MRKADHICNPSTSVSGVMTSYRWSLLTALFLLAGICCNAQTVQKSDLTGTWILDSIFVKDGWIKVIHYDKILIDSIHLTRTIAWDRGREKKFRPGNNIINNASGDTCTQIFRYKFKINESVIYLRKPETLYCCTFQCKLKIKSLGKFKRHENSLVIEDDHFLWYYHLQTIAP